MLAIVSVLVGGGGLVLEEREMSSFVFILLSNLYYFIKLYVKIRIWMLGLLLNELIQLIK